MTVKSKKCKNCGKEFKPYSSLEKTCSYACSEAVKKQKPNNVSTKKKKPLKTKPKKKQTRKQIISKLDRVVSNYIRLKYSKNGMCECISCDTILPIKGMHNAHWIDRGVLRYRFDEDNLRPACPGCNVYRQQHHMRVYTMEQIKRLGQDKVNEMLRLAKIPYKISIGDLRELLVEYEEKLENLNTCK